MCVWWTSWNGGAISSTTTSLSMYVCRCIGTQAWVSSILNLSPPSSASLGLSHSRLTPYKNHVHMVDHMDCGCDHRPKQVCVCVCARARARKHYIHLFMLIHKYISVYISTYIYTYLYVYICTYIQTCKYHKWLALSIFPCMCAYNHTHVHISHKHMHTLVHVLLCTLVSNSMCTHTHTHTHTLVI